MPQKVPAVCLRGRRGNTAASRPPAREAPRFRHTRWGHTALLIQLQQSCCLRCSSSAGTTPSVVLGDYNISNNGQDRQLQFSAQLPWKGQGSKQNPLQRSQQQWSMLYQMLYACALWKERQVLPGA